MKAKHGKILLGTLTSLLCAFITLSAHATNYTLTLNTNGSGTVSRDPTNSSYPSGVTVIITATPSAGWYFVGWTGDTNSQLNPLDVAMNSNMTVIGNFLQYPTYTVALATNGQGGIGLSPGGGSYQSNTLVMATATPAAGWIFTGWSGAASGMANPISFPVNASGTLTGTFAQLPGFDVELVSVTNKEGSTVNFTSHSVGSAPVGYTWYFGGGALNNATSATLTLTNITPAQAGNYWVVATNNWGSATSSVVSLVETNPIGATNVVTSPDQGSLQAAISLGGWVGIGFSGTLTLTNTINIMNNVVLDGTGVAAIISGGNAVQLFNVAQGASLTISNLTLANGSLANGLAGGGAVYNNGSLTVIGCTLTNNAAYSTIFGGAACGGAIYNNGGTVQLIQSQIISNSVVAGGMTSATNVIKTNSGLGGAIYNTNGTTTITRCTFAGNICQGLVTGGTAYYIDSGGVAHSVYTEAHGQSVGGAVFLASGSLSVTNSSFAFNEAIGGNGIQSGLSTSLAGSAYGGALGASAGTMAVEGCWFTNNSSQGGADYPYTTCYSGPGKGGAIYSTANMSLHNSSILNNVALGGLAHMQAAAGGYGGAVDNAGTCMVNDCVIGSNVAEGGQAFDENPYGSSTLASGDGCGGGIYNEALFAGTNCTVALNSALSGVPAANGLFGIDVNGNGIGGGIFNNTNALFLSMNLTVASNSCGTALPNSRGGFFAGAELANANGTLHVHNTLIAYGGANNCAYGTITDDGYNICSDGSAALYGGSSYNSTDPKLGPLGNYGGPTLCMALLSSSPAIDNADPNDFPSTDQRGYLRPFGSGPDMGAYEYGAVQSMTPNLSLNVSGNDAVLSFTMFPSNTYRLQWSTNLTTWVNLSTNGPVTTSTFITQPVSNQGAPRGFYRLLVQ